MSGRLGEYLLNQKAVNEAQLEAALELQSSVLVHRFLGDIFIEQQILSREDFEAYLKDYLHLKAADAMDEELRLGNLLVDAGRLSRRDLDEILTKQDEQGGALPLGALLIDAGYITTAELEVFLSNQQVMRDR